MGKLIGYTLAGGFIGWMVGSVVFLLIDPNNPRLLAILYAGAGVGGFIGFKSTGLVGIQFDWLTPRVKILFICAFITFTFYECSGFFKTGGVSGLLATLFYGLLIVVISLLFVYYTWQIAHYARGDSWPWLALLATLFLLGYLCTHNPAVAKNPSGGIFLAVLFGLVFLWLVVALISRPTWNSAVKALKDRDQEAEIKLAYGAKTMATINDLNHIAHTQGFYIAAPSFHWFGEGHMLTVGGTGSGKNAAILFPTFLSPAFLSTGTSTFCIDPKGESYAVCSEEMRRNGYATYLLNPFDLFGMGTHNFNLFDMIDRNSPDAVSFCQTVAKALCPVRGKSDNSDHFNEKAQGLLTFYMLHMLDILGTESSFVALYDMITMPGKKRLELLESMAESTAFRGAVAREAGAIVTSFDMGGEREMSGVYSSAEKSLKAFRNPQMQNIVEGSSFQLDELINNPTALFLAIPFNDLEDAAGWIRAMIAVLSRMIEMRQSRGRRLLMVLDEFAQLGYVKEVEKGFVTLRSFGVTYHIVVQDFQMLKTNYPGSYKNFSSSAAVKHILNVEDWETCKMLSETTGKDVNVVSMGENRSPHIVHKAVVPPEDFYNNHSHHYLFVRQMPNVIKMPKVFYYNNPYFKGRYAPNPLYSS